MFTEGTIYTRSHVIRMELDPMSLAPKTTIIARIPWWIHSDEVLYPDQDRCTPRERGIFPKCAPKDVRPCMLCSRSCCRHCAYADVSLGDMRFAAACDMNFTGLMVSGSQYAAAEYGMVGRYCWTCTTDPNAPSTEQEASDTINPWEGLRGILTRGWAGNHGAPE